MTSPKEEGERKDRWWWTKEVQTKLRTEKAAFKEWQKKGANREAWSKWYDQIETTEGKKSSYIIMKQMAASRKDVGLRGGVCDIDQKPGWKH